MRKTKKDRGFVKYIIGLITVIGLRLIPHPPNIEPIMSTTMPYAKKWRWLGGFIFAMLSVLIYDVITGTLGKWSFFTAGMFGLIGIAAGLFFSRKESSIKNYIIFAVIATIVYDAVTGIGMGVLIFNMPLSVTVIGQIPFTLMHLAGNIVLGAIVSPLLYRWVVDNKNLETESVLARIRKIFVVKA